MSNLREWVYRSLACDYSAFDTPRSVLLKQLLTHAGRTVPYYNSLFRERGLLVRDELNLDAYATLPPLERQTLVQQSVHLQSSITRSRDVYWNTSGGSTGSPVRVMQDREYLRKTRAVTLNQKNQWGYTVGDPLIKLWGDERELLEGRRSWRSALRRRLKKEILFNAFALDEPVMSAALERINHRRGTLVVGYVQALFELAGYILKNKRSVRPPRAVIVTAGVCYPEFRERITRAFGAAVVNRYGSREVGNIACEQPGIEGLVVAPTCLLEVDTGTNIETSGEGDILVTSLVNEVMPLIRYRIGDQGVLRTEGEQQTLVSVQGRSVDMFRTSDGKLVDGEFFTHLLYSVRGILKFQVIQRSMSLIEFIIQAESSEVQGEEMRIARAVRTVMGEDVLLKFSYVDAIPSHPSGKHRYTISEAT